jgi:hypothetical protein
MRTWGVGIGLNGAFANSGRFDDYQPPRMWLPRQNLLILGRGGGGVPLYAPQPELYSAVPEGNPLVVTGPTATTFWDGGPEISSAALGGSTGDMPAWSPVTGDFVTFGIGAGFRGVGAMCTAGTRWFTQLPIYEGQSSVYVREDGDAIVVARGEAWVLDGRTGEMMSTTTFALEDGTLGMPAGFHPGCGVLVMFGLGRVREWRWLDDETMEMGPWLRLPEDDPSSSGLWSGTEDCGVVAVGSTSVTRLEADGTTRYRVPFRDIEEVVTPAAPPVALADGGTLLLMSNPPGWNRLSSMGELVDRYRLGPSAAERAVADDPLLGPDGTLYLMTRVDDGPIRFTATYTGAIPGPFLWPDSGLNWARTNSVLPE